MTQHYKDSVRHFSYYVTHCVHKYPVIFATQIFANGEHSRNPRKLLLAKIFTRTVFDGINCMLHPLSPPVSRLVLGTVQVYHALFHLCVVHVFVFSIWREVVLVGAADGSFHCID